MSEMKKIGIITSGGDCGGLNAVIKGASLMAESLGMELFVIPNGYAGLYNLIDFESLVRLDFKRTDLINLNLAGSEAGHSRVKIKKIADEKKYERIKQGLKKFKIDGLVISGGDDSGSVVVDLLENNIPCVHAPKTMDLDLQTYSVGGDSTINRIATFVNDLKTTAVTHNRILVVEVFGRYAGHTAFRGGVCADADSILIPEIPTDFDLLHDHIRTRFMQRIDKSDVKAGAYIIVVAEGLTDASGKELVDDSAGVDAFGHKKLTGAGKYVCQEVTKRLKADPEIVKFMKRNHMYVEGILDIPEVRQVTPGHLVRCGNTSAYDANFGKEIGAASIMLLNKGIFGVTVANMHGKEVYYMKIADAIKQRHVDLNDVALHEHMGIFFGRQAAAYTPIFKEIKDTPVRYM